MSIESTMYHEAGHAALFLLAEDIFGAPRMISALPDGENLGFVMPSGDTLTDFSPKVVRSYGRMLMAGGIAQRLAGFPVGGIGSDARQLSNLAVREKCGDGFIQECIDGAEFLLRMHWGGVENIAATLKTCGGCLAEGAGIELARMALHKKPMRQLGLDAETILRLAPSLEKAPEIADPLKAALAAFVLPKPPAKPRNRAPAKHTYTRPTGAYLDPVQGIETSGGRAVVRRPSNRRRRLPKRTTSRPAWAPRPM